MATIDYKQKIKDYMNSSEVDTLYKSMLINLFPELREKSEDERIMGAFRDFAENYLFWGKFGLTKEKALAWLEKQKSNVDNTNKEYWRGYREGKQCILDKYSEIEKQGEQKPADKVEPKFKVEDWIITNKNHIWYVDEIPETTSYLYRLINQYGKVEVAEFEVVDKKARLWSIQDAKDGDVLVINNEIFIYAHRKQMYSIAVAHCFVDSAGGFYLDGEFGYTENGNLIQPATKEQRDTLFAKMKETGYEWDAEKRELKKIEQKPVYSEDRNKELSLSLQIQAYLNTASDELYAKGKSLYSEKRLEDIHKCMLMWQKLHNAYFYQKFVWSEEDERIRIKTIELLETANHPNKMRSNGKPLDFTENINWLKSLKDRVQPKQEWSEEDIATISRVISIVKWAAYSDHSHPIINDNGATELVERLNSLKERYAWKPSDEQMDALHYVTNFDYGGYKAILVSLYEQLKKLREE